MVCAEQNWLFFLLFFGKTYLYWTCTTMQYHLLYFALKVHQLVLTILEIWNWGTWNGGGVNDRMVPVVLSYSGHEDCGRDVAKRSSLHHYAYLGSVFSARNWNLQRYLEQAKSFLLCCQKSRTLLASMQRISGHPKIVPCWYCCHEICFWTSLQ